VTCTGPDLPDWANFNGAQQARPVRPLAILALKHLGPGEGRTAVELGSGAGIEAGHLARNGWQVHSYDSDRSVSAAMTSLGIRLPVRHTTIALEQLADLPPCDLILACFSLPFLGPAEFHRLWDVVRRRLNSTGLLAVDLFGHRDDWAKGHGTFLTRLQVDGLFEGLEVISLVEEEQDGLAFSGPKHWHTYQVIARKP